MTEQILYIAGQIMDLVPDVITRTIQVNELGELKDRQANYSNTIKLPKTPNNIKVLDMLGISGNTSRKPYEKVPCKYVVDGIELVPFGSAVINELSDGIDVVIYDGNISISDALNGKTLNQLDWSEWNHQLSLESYTASFSNTEGYIYANGRFFISEDVFIGNLVDAIDVKTPSLYIHTIFDMIITQAGFTWSGDIQQDDDFLNRLTTVENGYDRTIIDLGTGGGQDYNMSLQDSYIRDDQANDFVDENVLDSFISTGGNNTLNLTGTFDDQTSDAVRFELHLNGNAIAQVELTGLDGTQQLNETISFSSQQGDLVELVVLGFAKDVGNSTFIVQYVYDFAITVDYVPMANKYIDIDFAEIIGEQTQLNFIKDVMQRYGLVFQKRPFENHLDFIKIETLLNDRGNSGNLSTNYVGVESVNYKPNFKKFNYANYKYDEDTEPFANGTLTIDNDNIGFAGDLFTSIFIASKDSINPQNPNTKLFISKHFEVTEEDGIQTVTPIEDNLRFFKLIYRNESHEYQFSDDANKQTFTGNVPTLTFDDDTKYQSYINNYYSTLNKYLSDFRLFEVTMKLNLLEVQGFDLLKIYYIDKLGSYFYINKISNYRPDRLTKVEMMKV
jgi:hypothetical protein